MKKFKCLLLVAVLGITLTFASSCFPFPPNQETCEHEWGEWTVVEEPTTEKEGLKEHTCTICDKVEQKSIKKLEPEIKSISKYDSKYKTYVHVDISEQNFIYVEDKKIVLDGRVVTGMTSNDCETPTGVYNVTQKESNTKLTGPTWNYDVKRWIGFIGGEYGFHDASWQPDKYFDDKNAYKKHGSHGCVNMREKDIIKLYDLVDIGTTVIIDK